MMTTETKPKLQRRLKLVAGQVAGIQKMVDEERYCVEILDQISAVRSALNAVGVELLADHLQGCVLGHGTDSQHPASQNHTPEELVEEVRLALGRFLK